MIIIVVPPLALLAVTWTLLAGVLAVAFIPAKSSWWRRIGGGLLASVFSLVICALIFDYTRLGTLKTSLRHLREFSRIEECQASGQKARQSSAGLAAFQEWAAEVRKSQQKSKGATTSDADTKAKASARSFSKTDESECELKRPEESWPQYRLRLLKTRVRSMWAAIRKQSGTGPRNLVSGFITEAEARIHDHWIETREAFQRRMAAGVHERREFHLLWTDFSPEPGTVLWDLYLEGASDPERVDPILALLLQLFQDAPLAQSSSLKAPSFAVRSGIDPAVCQEILKAPGGDPDLRVLRDYLGIATDSCRLRMRKDGCEVEEFARAVSLTCVLRAPAGTELKRETHPVQWIRELTPDLEVSVEILRIPEDYFQASTGKEWRALLRLAHELARTLDPRFTFRAPDDQLRGSEAEKRIKLALLNGPDLPLTRFGALDFFSPFETDGFPEEVERLLPATRLRPSLEDLARQFRTSFRSRKGTL